MIRNLYTRLTVIVLITIVAVWIDTRQQITITNPINGQVIYSRNVSPRLGLDLRGGLQVLLEADLPADTPVDGDALKVARTILENRTNALGVSENVLQVAGERRIVGEFPGLEDAESVLSTLQQTGLLEFVHMGSAPVPAGTIVQTDFGLTPESLPTTPAPAPAVDPGQDATPPADTPATPEPFIYHTIMTGRALQTVAVGTDDFGRFHIQFSLNDEGKDVFADYTTENVGNYLAIVLDKQVISVPVVQSPIRDGAGVIQGSFTAEEANALAIQLRYGSLPIPMKIVETRIIGPTLGEDSLQKSLLAGLVGMTIVILFMGLYYRLPGIIADLAILFYAAIAFALFKFIPVTLTLPGIAGFLLSTGSALDANILIFERIKEELRNGLTLAQAVDRGWERARSSIFDSNFATLITSGILFWFGSTFGATIVKGFSLTLAIGVAISLFTAIYVTRSLLALVLRFFKPANLDAWFGL